MPTSRWVDKENAVNLPNGELFGHKERWNPVICWKMNETREICVKRNEPDTKKAWTECSLSYTDTKKSLHECRIVVTRGWKSMRRVDKGRLALISVCCTCVEISHWSKVTTIKQVSSSVMAGMYQVLDSHVWSVEILPDSPQRRAFLLLEKDLSYDNLFWNRRKLKKMHITLVSGIDKVGMTNLLNSIMTHFSNYLLGFLRFALLSYFC